MSLKHLGSKNRALLHFVRYYSGQGASSSANQNVSTSTIKDVPGLSEKVILKPESSSIGPGVSPSKAGEYKVPEYFCYDITSYYEAENEMAKYRLPQPSALSNSK